MGNARRPIAAPVKTLNAAELTDAQRARYALARRPS
jgi:hypothetical protein